MSVRATLKFDLSTIPSGSAVASASISLFVTNVSIITLASGPLTVYKLTEDWDEDNVTYSKRTAAANWTTAGGQYDPTALTNVQYSALTKGTWVTFQIPASLVQGWINTPSSNYGVLLKREPDQTDPYGAGNTGINLNNASFVSSEHTNASLRPKLVVDYTAANVKPFVSVALTNITVMTPYQNQTIAATASDDVAVTSVNFYANGTLIAQDTTAPYSIIWTNMPPGSYTLTAVAWDSTSCSTSAPVTVKALSSIYSANMDSNPGWTLDSGWQYGQPSGYGKSHDEGDPTSGFSGNNVIGFRFSSYAGGGFPVSYATTPAIDCSGYSNTWFTFAYWLGLGPSSWQSASVEVSTNLTSWTTLWANPGEAMTLDCWRPMSFDVSAIADRCSTVYFRWMIGPNSVNYSYSGWNIDDVKVCGAPIGQALVNRDAVSITSTTATLRAYLACTGRTYVVNSYWGTSNGGTNAASWNSSAYVGTWTNASWTNISCTATGLQQSTQYYFTFCATNSSGKLWATNTASFNSAGPPSVNNGNGATNRTASTALLGGTLSGWTADVRIYWGTADGGTNKSSWANVNLLTNVALGSFSNTVSNLLYGLTYYYRCYASNSLGAAWSAGTTNFTVTKPLGISPGWSYSSWTGDADCGVTNDGTYTVAMNCGGAAVTINGVPFQASATSGANFSIGGTALTTTDSGNNISGNSATLSTSFMYGGNPRTITLSNLTPGKLYKTTMYSCGWGASQVQLFASGSDSQSIDQNAYGTYNGIKISYLFFAGSTSRAITITPSGTTFYMYGLANGERPFSSPQYLTNSPAINMTATSAVLKTTLGCTGSVYNVYVQWNSFDAGTNAATWTNSAFVGSWTNINSTNISYLLSGLTRSNTYYYTFRASNACEQIWATTALNFDTLTGLLADTNADGIADVWTSLYFTSNPSAAAATNDADGDGHNNLKEYIAGCSPTNKNDSFQVSITYSNGMPFVSFSARTTTTNYYGALIRHYSLEQLTNIISTNWIKIPGYENITASNQTITFSDSTSTNLLFYRAKAWLQ